jgi:phenylpropionate dioxygenase-like ring-hydroxylating dioxygenase large terminal subunit
MNRELELELLDEARARIASKRADVPTGDAVPDALRAADYISPDQLARERALLFRRAPLCVGFSSQVAQPGQFVTHAETDVPILVARGTDGVLRAFVNACRHRGTLLEDAPCGGGAKAFVCPYHAWSYDLAGKLLGTPHGDVGFPALDRAQHGLHQLAVGEHAGLVFVVPEVGRGPLALDLDAYLGPLGAELAGLGFGSHVLFASSRRVRKLNWKLMMDSSYESYHFRVVHAKSIYPLFHDNTGVFAWHDPHCRLVLPKRSIAKLDPSARDQWRLRDHANVIYGLFPNTIALVQPDHAMVISAWPIDVDTTAITAGMLIPEAPATERAEAHWRKNEQIFWDAIEEDIAITERIQRTLRAVPGARLPLGAFEHLLARYHAAIARALAG